MEQMAEEQKQEGRADGCEVHNRCNSFMLTPDANTTLDAMVKWHLEPLGKRRQPVSPEGPPQPIRWVFGVCAQQRAQRMELPENIGVGSGECEAVDLHGVFGLHLGAVAQGQLDNAHL